jgi:hypothetical protein
MCQQVTGNHDERGMRQRRRKLVHRRLEQPPVCVGAILAEGGGRCSIKYRLPFGWVSAAEVAYQCRVGHRVEVEVGDEQELCIRRVADSLRRQAYGDKQN